jgi:radical SAM protein with 4Fe4S-binding SPASM domain
MQLNVMTDRQAIRRKALDRSPQLAVIALPTRCNLSCKMCGSWRERDAELVHDKILSLINEARTLGATDFSPCGTEPFMREDTLEILEYAEHVGFQRITVISNGVLLNKAQQFDALERLKNLNIVISLDGPEEVHDSLRGKGVFKGAVEALRELRRREITCSIASIIMRQTIDRLAEIVDLAADLGIPVISMQPYERDAGGRHNDHSQFEFRPEEEEIVHKKLMGLMSYADRRKIIVYTASLMKYVPAFLARGIRKMPPTGCLVPSRLMIVDSAGECYSCFKMRNSMRHKSMGNVLEKSLDEIWHNAAHRELTLLALNGQCPGCLAACSDVENFNSLALTGRLSKHAGNLIRRLVRGLKPSW